MQALITWLENLSQQVPVTYFTFIGAFLEEAIAPIPSPLVMLLAGSIAESQGSPASFLLILALIGAASKTLGSYIIYVLGDKAEDLIVGKFGRFLGVSHDDTKGLSSFLSQGRRDDVVIFLMRAIPIMPTAPVSVIAGLIKLNLKTYLVSTFLGLLVRNFIYLYLGYASLGTLESLSEGFDSVEKVGYFILSVFGGLALLWLFAKRNQQDSLNKIDRLISSAKRIFKM